MKSKKWLMKSEPDVYSIDHLIEDGVTHWEGIRNYQARNFMMNDMSIGDEVFFYHSNTEIPGIVGLAEVSSEALVVSATSLAATVIASDTPRLRGVLDDSIT